jgi:hypothetical protein
MFVAIPLIIIGLLAGLAILISRAKEQVEKHHREHPHHRP